MPDTARILIIDDDRAFRVGTGALLADEGYEVEAAASGNEGLEKLRDDQFDMVLLDLRMEGRTGLSVLEELRQGGNDVPVLMLTGFATVDSAVAALKLGADDYLTKPCDNALLRSKIKAILARREPVLGAGAARIVGAQQQDARRQARHRPGGAHGKHRPAARRHGDRQGAHRPRAARGEPAPRRAPSWPSTARRWRRGCWSRSSSATRGARSPAR